LSDILAISTSHIWIKSQFVQCATHTEVRAFVYVLPYLKYALEKKSNNVYNIYNVYFPLRPQTCSER